MESFGMGDYKDNAPLLRLLMQEHDSKMLSLLNLEKVETEVYLKMKGLIMTVILSLFKACCRIDMEDIAKGQQEITNRVLGFNDWFWSECGYERGKGSKLFKMEAV